MQRLPRSHSDLPFGFGQGGRVIDVEEGIVADPRTLGILREAYGDDLKSVIIAEIAKDLTNHPLDQIEAVINAHDNG